MLAEINTGIVDFRYSIVKMLKLDTMSQIELKNESGLLVPAKYS